MKLALSRKKNVLANIDWFTVLLYFALVFIGWINIYAAVYNQEHQSIFDITQRYGKQLLWISATVVLIFLVFLIDSNFYSFFSYLVYVGVILILIAVLIVGKEVNGARSWFEIGSFRLQPAEFAKFATNLALAKFLSTPNLNIHKIKNLVLTGIIVFMPSLLILLQNDTGSALVYVAFIFVLYREGLSGKFLFIGLLAGILFVAALMIDKIYIILGVYIIALLVYYFLSRKPKGLAFVVGLMVVASGFLFLISYLFTLNLSVYIIMFLSLILILPVLGWYIFRYKLVSSLFILLFLLASNIFTYSVDYFYNNILEEHQQKRIDVLLGKEQDVYGAGYNVNQSKIAIGSGGFSGKGFLNGTQTKFDFVPEQSTDFIFCTVGEEWGFLGTSVVIVLFLTLILRLIFLAERQRSKFSRIYGYGVVSILFFHFMVNVGMTIGLAPVIGIPLPFFSYGGSSLWAFTILLFIFIRLDTGRMDLLV